VLAGFEGDLQDKIIGANAHILLKHERDEPLVFPEGAIDRVRAVDGIAAAAPYIEGEVAFASQSNYDVGLVFGIDPEQSPEVLDVFAHVEKGSLDGLIDEMRPTPPRPELEAGQEFAPPAPLPGIVLGRELAKNLSVTVGDRIRVISPLLETMTPIGGAIPKSRGFRVEGVFSVEMYEFDARYAYVSLKAARQFLELDGDQIAGLQIRADDPERAAVLGDLAVAAARGQEPVPGLKALDWQQRNQTLFSALKLERVVAFIVLVFIILVASFSIVNTLTMSVIEKKREITILMTMGARQVGVMKLFLVQGMLVGVFGTAIGAVAAVLTAIALQHIGFGIPGDVYYITNLPVRVGVGDVVLIGLAALLIVWDFAVFPALRGSRLEPVEGLRDG
jgi:lipoprotein-releasing system permease protein